ncbi:MAG: murein L,D-transpeptidase catalytic domain family protein, partial [Pedobacter sp.]|nr:murein L,D-transpeptidase catalytic domain family protein [Pedobacter sp.]
VKLLYGSEFASIVAADSLYNAYTLEIFKDAHLDSAGLNPIVFQKAITGFYNLQSSGLSSNTNILTVIDFDKGSCTKRLFLIDIVQRKLLLNTWVAHGKNSGDNKPDHFSNVVNSNESSIGFYLTGEAYFGKNGRSMRLDGVDDGFNDNARSRNIVLHGADYVSQDCIDGLGRLGRSFGCPAVARDLSDNIIDATLNRSVMFINHSQDDYYSQYLDIKTAALFAQQRPSFLANI